MKSRDHLSTLSLFPALLLALASLTAFAHGQAIYDNGPIDGTQNAWQINFGNVVSDSFSYKGAVIKCDIPPCVMDFGVWANPGDTPETVGWSITSAPNGGTIYASGTLNLMTTFISNNEFGYAVDKESVEMPAFNLSAGTYWLNLQNATSAQGNPLYWDENSGVGCTGDDGNGDGCPSQAWASGVGTIPSESFTLSEGSDGGTTPEPSNLVLFGSGILGLGRLLRRRFLG